MKSKSFSLDIVVPDKTVFSGEVNRFFAPSVEGYFEILPNHTHFLVALKTGEVKVTKENTKEYFAISGGFAEVFDNRVIVLAETAEHSENIDTERAEKSKERALKRLADKSPSINIERAEAALMRALTRLSVVEKK